MIGEGREGGGVGDTRGVFGVRESVWVFREWVQGERSGRRRGRRHEDVEWGAWGGGGQGDDVCGRTFGGGARA